MNNRAEKFLEAYRRTGRVAPAARLAKIDRTTHYRRLRTDPAYRAAFADAERDAAHLHNDELKAWAFEGYEEPVIYQGHLCYEPDQYLTDPKTKKPTLILKPDAKPLTRRRRSETLAMFIMRGLMPEVYGRHEPPPPNADGQTTWEEFIQIYRRTTATDAAPPPSPE